MVDRNGKRFKSVNSKPAGLMASNKYVELPLIPPYTNAFLETIAEESSELETSENGTMSNEPFDTDGVSVCFEYDLRTSREEMRYLSSDVSDKSHDLVTYSDQPRCLHIPVNNHEFLPKQNQHKQFSADNEWTLDLPVTLLETMRSNGRESHDVNLPTMGRRGSGKNDIPTSSDQISLAQDSVQIPNWREDKSEDLLILSKTSSKEEFVWTLESNDLTKESSNCASCSPGSYGFRLNSDVNGTIYSEVVVPPCEKLSPRYPILSPQYALFKCNPSKDPDIARDLNMVHHNSNAFHRSNQSDQNEYNFDGASSKLQNGQTNNNSLLQQIVSTHTDDIIPFIFASSIPQTNPNIGFTNPCYGLPCFTDITNHSNGGFWPNYNQNLSPIPNNSQQEQKQQEQYYHKNWSPDPNITRTATAVNSKLNCDIKSSQNVPASCISQNCCLPNFHKLLHNRDNLFGPPTHTISHNPNCSNGKRNYENRVNSNGYDNKNIVNNNNSHNNLLTTHSDNFHSLASVSNNKNLSLNSVKCKQISYHTRLFENPNPILSSDNKSNLTNSNGSNTNWSSCSTQDQSNKSTIPQTLSTFRKDNATKSELMKINFMQTNPNLNQNIALGYEPNYPKGYELVNKITVVHSDSTNFSTESGKDLQSKRSPDNIEQINQNSNSNIHCKDNTFYEVVEQNLFGKPNGNGDVNKLPNSWSEDQGSSTSWLATSTPVKSVPADPNLHQDASNSTQHKNGSTGVKISRNNSGDNEPNSGCQNVGQTYDDQESNSTTMTTTAIPVNNKNKNNINNSFHFRPLHRSPAVLGVSELLVKSDDELCKLLQESELQLKQNIKHRVGEPFSVDKEQNETYCGTDHKESESRSSMVSQNEDPSPARRRFFPHYLSRDVQLNRCNDNDKDNPDFLERRSFYDYGCDEEDYDDLDDVIDDDDMLPNDIAVRLSKISHQNYVGDQDKVFPLSDSTIVDRLRQLEAQTLSFCWRDDCQSPNHYEDVELRSKMHSIEQMDVEDLPYIDNDIYLDEKWRAEDFRIFKWPKLADLEEITLSSGHCSNRNSWIETTEANSLKLQPVNPSIPRPCIKLDSRVHTKSKSGKTVKIRTRRDYHSCDSSIFGKRFSFRSKASHPLWFQRLFGCVRSSRSH